VDLDKRGTVIDCRLVAFGVGDRPERLHNAEAMLKGEIPRPALSRTIARDIVRHIDPRADHHASSQYRKEAIEALLCDVLDDIRRAPGEHAQGSDAHGAHRRASESLADSTRRFGIGASVARSEDQRLLTGNGCYVADVTLPSALHALVVRSPHAHARIRAIACEAARCHAGVHAVFTFADLGEQAKPLPIRLGPLPGFERYRQLPLASDVVRYVGEPVAVIVAESRYVAEDALELVDIDYEPVTAVASIEAALRDDSIVHAATGTNRGARYQVGYGDTDTAFRDAPYTRKETFYSHRHGGVPLECRGLAADWDDTNRRLRIFGAGKVVYYNRRALASILGLPEDEIEMIEVDIGGGFGVRGELYPEDVLVSLCAMRLGRAVQWIEDRREHLMASNHSREVECELEIAAERDGTIRGLRGRLIADMGAYIRTNGGVVPSKTAQFLPGPYRIRSVAFDIAAVITNKTPIGTYRGPGRYEATFFRERLLDLMAADLGLSPVEVRRKNLLRAHELPWSIGRLVPHEDPTEYDNGDYPQAFERALELIDHANLSRQRTLPDGRLTGIGVAAFVEATGAGNNEAARIIVRDIDRIELYIGSSNMGQGHETTMAQVLTETLGVPFAAIVVLHPGTGVLEWGYGSFASRSMVMQGNATKAAADKLRAQLINWVATVHGLEPSMLAFDGARVTTVREDDAQGQRIVDVPLVDIVAAARAGDAGAQRSLDAAATFTQPRRTYSYGTQVAQVAVDPRTAEVEVLRFVTVEDVGRVVNPAIVAGQSLGATAQGIGGTFLEEFKYDEHGQLLTGTFADYLLPTALDCANIEAHTVDLARSTLNPLGIKGAGEGGVIATGAALANAVADALKPLGVDIVKLPLSIDNLAQAIRIARDRRSN
jgi:carbon-monoxide dehydrogenase large subunit